MRRGTKVFDKNDKLTYKSIRDEIAMRCREGRLFRMMPTLPNLPVKRTILLSRDIRDALFHLRPEGLDGPRLGQLLRDFDRFIEGGRITIRDGGYRSGPAYLARLEPPTTELWEIRSVDPRPGLRVMGRFAEPDVFVALLLLQRKSLGAGDSQAWRQAECDCKARWRQLFPDHAPHAGKRVCDYVSSGGFLLRPLRSARRDSAGGPFLFPCVDEGEIS